MPSRVRKLESSRAFSWSEMKSAHVRNKTAQRTYVGESNSTPSDVRQLSREGVKSDWRDEKRDGAADGSHTQCWLCFDPIFISPSWFNAQHGLTLHMGSRPDYWRNELLCRAGDIERHPGSKTSTSFVRTGRPHPGHTAHHCATRRRGSFGARRVLASQGHSWDRRIRQLRSQRIGACCPPVRYVMTRPFQTCKTSCESETFMSPKNASARISPTFRTQVCAQ